MIDGLNQMKSDLLSILADSDGLSEEKIQKIQKSVEFASKMIYDYNKKELFIETASDILHNREHNISIIQSEYSEDDGDVWFEYYIASHDYSAGRDSSIIRKADIEMEIKKNNRDNKLNELLKK